MRRVAGGRESANGVKLDRSAATGATAKRSQPPPPAPALAAAETKTSIGTGADPGLKVNNAQSTNAQAD